MAYEAGEKTHSSGSASPHTNGKPWYGDGLRFSCTQCGNCCTGAPGFVWFTPEEGRAMAMYLGVSESDFYARFCKKKLNRWTLDEMHTPTSRYDCVFLRRDEAGKALCSIYPVRPTQCRTWPFWDSNLKSKRAWDASAQVCPGMKQGGAGAEAGGTFLPVEKIRVLVESNPRGL